MDGRTIGILGGGQLGRMIIEAGHRLGVRIAVLDPGGATSPAGQLADIVIEGSFVDEEKIRELGTFIITIIIIIIIIIITITTTLASICDLLTIEIEHVNVNILGNIIVIIIIIIVIIIVIIIRNSRKGGYYNITISVDN